MLKRIQLAPRVKEVKATAIQKTKFEAKKGRNSTDRSLGGQSAERAGSVKKVAGSSLSSSKQDDPGQRVWPRSYPNGGSCAC